MSIDLTGAIQLQTPQIPKKALPLIQTEDIKAILYLGLKGDITLPVPEHEVDILV